MGDVVKGVGGMVDNTLGTSIFGQNANDLAAEAQGRATGQANSALTTAYNDQKGYLNPYNTAGTSALSTLAGGNILQNFHGDPGYQFQLNEGNKGINASMAARGMGNSGAALKALTRFNQDYASNAYDKAYNREFTRLNTLAGMGQNAATNLSGAAGAYGQGLSNNYTGLGNAQAGAAIGKGNQQSGFVGNVMGFFSDERLKTEFKEIKKSKLDEMKKELKAWAFKYKDEMKGEGEWIGVMAQDLEKTPMGRELVFENSKGEKQIHIGKAVSMWLATLAEA